ncbi:Uncharacterised protein [Mobiluncus curtisii subsp. curtisii]|nr:Uncharacterised protein [Mobiluncus curtisii subsp. curtisii]
MILRSKITESFWVHFFVGRVYPVRKYLKGLGTRTREGQRRVNLDLLDIRKGYRTGDKAGKGWENPNKKHTINPKILSFIQKLFGSVRFFEDFFG